MSKEIYISSTPHETRLAIVEKDELTEIYYERENEYTLAGSIYNGKVTRVLPGMQSSFVDIGLERDAFLYITDFMEEQGETADFDSGENRGGGRKDRGGEGRGRGRRDDELGGEPALTEGEPTARASEERRDRPERADRPDRTDRPERTDRSERTDRPDRTDRNAQRDRRRDAPIARDARADQGSPAQTAPQPAEAADRAEPSEGEEIGAGAPGADGGRRWRGRRGRRRRGALEHAGGETASVAPLAETHDEPAVEADDDEGTAEFLRAVADTTPASTAVEGRGDRGGRRDRRRDERRDDRRDDRQDGRRSEGGRSETPAAETPRDGGRERTGRRDERFAARGSEGREPAETGPAPEPFILPGESLSKYRKGGESEATGGNAAQGRPAAAPMLTSKPSTQMELAGPWDGGATLPGETLSRYREAPAASRAEVRPREERGFVAHDAPAREESAVGRDRRRDRDMRRGRASGEAEPTRAPAGLSPAEAVQPGVASFHDVEETRLPLHDDGSARGGDHDVSAPTDDVTTAAFEEVEMEAETEVNAAPEPFPAQAASDTYEAQTDLAPASEATPSVVLGAVEEFHETVADFEPGEDASASYRVDPAGPSEFRQSVPDAEGVVDVRFDEDDPIAQEGRTHEFTAVQPTGEMISEWPLVPESETAAQDAAAENAPVAQEAAVQSTTLEHAEAPALPGGPLGFNPGDGQLEEELLDEEDGDLPQLLAAGDDEMEEETLESDATPHMEQTTEFGTDLGSLLREMSIDQITSADPAGPEDEFELDDEDDLEDDEELEEDELEADEEEMSEEEFADAPNAAETGQDRERSDFAGDPEFEEEGSEEPVALGSAPETSGAGGTAAREGERRDGRRGGRDRGRGGDREKGRDRDRRPSGGGRPGGRMSRHQAQTSDLPAISDLLKPGQELLVQIAKEPIAKKGARITSHIALPGRFLVFMPTVQHVGVSRKIESDGERRRLKEILISERGEASGGFIVRTAASGASEEELRSDLRFLLNLWADIKQRSESSKSPALIYHDLNLVERILRDQVTDNFSAIWVDTETEYERVLRFLQRFQPSLIRRVKLYTKDTPLFEQFGITEEINKALRSKVWLKSGGSIVINQTEALVAIDINTGKYVGKTARLEDTIVKTNLDAIPEIVRQIRLRDLGGIIVIDFIDMDERRNRAKVLATLEEELKSDRAPSKVLQFNDFGLVAITRKRVKQSLERTLSQTCNTCAGTGMVKSPTTVCNEIYVEFRKMAKHLDKGDVMLRVNPEVVKQLKAGGGKWLQEIEEVAGKTILVKSDPSLHPEQFDIQ